MASLSSLRDGIKTRLATISGLRAYDTWPDQPNVPAAIVKPLRWDYRQAIGGVNRVTFEIIILAAGYDASTIGRAQEKLDAYLDDTGSNSVKAAIEADKTLSGSASTLQVPGWTDYGVLDANGIEYMGAKLEVEVWA